MNSKNIIRHLRNKINDWIDHVEDEKIKEIIKENVIVTGGALVSLLTGEDVNDYDIYFKTEDSCFEVAGYYSKLWNSDPKNRFVEVSSKDGRITCMIRSSGIADEEGEDFDDIEPYAEEMKTEKKIAGKASKNPYRPKFFSTNAISLSDKIQLVIRFYGGVDEIHTNYDFVHCTCSYDYFENSLKLPSKALECIINKELHYMGSKYPLCSIIRTRKFIERGWHINAGQYLKMAFQLNELDLTNFEVLTDQLAGVDSAYFATVIDEMKGMKERNPEFKPDEAYYFDVINKIFG